MKGEILPEMPGRGKSRIHVRRRVGGVPWRAENANFLFPLPQRQDLQKGKNWGFEGVPGVAKNGQNGSKKAEIRGHQEPGLGQAYRGFWLGWQVGLAGLTGRSGVAYRGLPACLIGDVGRSGLRLIGVPGRLMGSLRFGFVLSRSGWAGVSVT